MLKKFGKWYLYALGAFAVFAMIAGLSGATEPDAQFKRAQQKNDIALMKKISNNNPDLIIGGEKASDIVIRLEEKQKAEAERLAKEKAETERVKKEKLAKELAIAKSNGYNSYAEYQKAEAEKIAKEKIEAEKKAEAEKIAKERAKRTINVDRNELNRVLSRPSKYLGKIIHYKEKITWDYVIEYATLDTDNSKLKLMSIYKVKAKGANWKENLQPMLFIPIDIYNEMDDKFYNKTGKNMGDYLMQTNEIEMIAVSGKKLNKIFKHGQIDRYVDNGETALIITKINIYNRNLGMFKTHIIKY